MSGTPGGTPPDGQDTSGELREPRGPGEPDGLDTQHAHGARIYDYILGGKDHYPIDKEAGDAALAVWPALRTHMRAGRSFMHRAVRYLAAEKGVRSSSTSAPASRPAPTSMRSPSTPLPDHGSCTSTTTPSW